MQELNVQVWESSSRSAGDSCLSAICLKFARSASKCYIHKYLPKALPLPCVRVRLELGANVREHCCPAECTVITSASAKGFVMVIIALRSYVKVIIELLLSMSLFQYFTVMK